MRKSRTLLLIVSVGGLGLVALAWWVAANGFWGPAQLEGVTVEQLTRHGEAYLPPSAGG